MEEEPKLTEIEYIFDIDNDIDIATRLYVEVYDESRDKRYRVRFDRKLWYGSSSISTMAHAFPIYEIKDVVGYQKRIGAIQDKVCDKWIANEDIASFHNAVVKLSKQRINRNKHRIPVYMEIDGKDTIVTTRDMHESNIDRTPYTCLFTNRYTWGQDDVLTDKITGKQVNHAYGSCYGIRTMELNLDDIPDDAVEVKFSGGIDNIYMDIYLDPEINIHVYKSKEDNNAS